MTEETLCMSLTDALRRWPPPPGNLALPVFERGALTVELYTPIGTDKQQPHERDELYVVARGSADFVDDRARGHVETGSLVFVAAGQRHRFENFSADFAVWVVFFGPVGGDAG